MKVKGPLAVLVCLVLSLAEANPADLPRQQDVPVLAQDKPKDKPPEKKPPDNVDPGANPAATNDALAQAPQQGGEAPASGFNPNVLGDFQGVFGWRFVMVPTTQTINTVQTTTQTQTRIVNTVILINGELTDVRVPVTTTTTNQIPVTLTVPGTTKVLVSVPIADRGSLKIGENESPLPQDRVYCTYNFYSDVRGPDLGSGQPRFDTQATTFNGNPATITTPVPNVTPAVQVHRETFGVEKTFLDSAGSFGLRVPLLQTLGTGTFDGIGDLTGIFKYVFLQDNAGSLLSGGLALTVPTGPAFSTIAGDIHSTIFQPFIGFRIREDRLLFQGFSSVAVPTDSRDVTLMFNDFALGYLIYSGAADQTVTSVYPTLEAHVTTPLDNRGDTAAIFVPDQVVMTAGAQVGLYNRSFLTLAIATPVTRPRCFDVEAIVQFNWWF